MSNVILVLSLFVIIAVLIRVISGAEKRKAKYDERMVIEQLKGYKYGAYGAAFVGAGICLLELFKKDTLILTAGAAGFLVFIVILIGYATYATWHKSWVGIGMSWKRLSAFYLVIGTFELVLTVINIMDGTIVFTDMIDASDVSTLLFGICFLWLGIVTVASYMRKEEED